MRDRFSLLGASLALLAFLAACGSNQEERAATGGLGGAAFGIGRGIGNEIFGNNQPAAAPAR